MSDTTEGLPLGQVECDGFCEECGEFDYCLYAARFGIFLCQDCEQILEEIYDD